MRTELEGRQVRYTIHSYATDRPEGQRYENGTVVGADSGYAGPPTKASRTQQEAVMSRTQDTNDRENTQPLADEARGDLDAVSGSRRSRRFSISSTVIWSL